MLIKEEHFRNLYKKIIVIKNKEFAHQIAQTFQIDTVWSEEISDEELMERLNSIKTSNDINSILAVPYIDHTAGISFLVLALSHWENNEVDITKREDFSVWSIARMDNFLDSEFEYLKNLKINDDFELDYYSDYINQLKSYDVNDEITALRYIELLDEFRHEQYPDDVEVVFIKEDLQMEKMWVRYEKIIDAPIIEGKLLNQPFQDFGVNAGDKVKIFPYKTDEDEIILISNLNDS